MGPMHGKLADVSDDDLHVSSAKVFHREIHLEAFREGFVEGLPVESGRPFRILQSFFGKLSRGASRNHGLEQRFAPSVIFRAHAPVFQQKRGCSMGNMLEQVCSANAYVEHALL